MGYISRQQKEGGDHLPTGGPSLTPLIPLSTGGESTPTTSKGPGEEVKRGARGGGSALKSTGAAGGSLPGSSSKREGEGGKGVVMVTMRVV